MTSPAISTLNDVDEDALSELLGRYSLSLLRVRANDRIPGSFWGEPEAGIIGKNIYARGDTPLHSILHECCHIICMDKERRRCLDRDAGGDDLEESAVCYLQIVLAGELPAIGRRRLMDDMDAWGYSFRLGSTRRWFADDADDARDWLHQHRLLQPGGRPVYRCRA
ncbi:MAG: hypothetical protein HKN77_10210 [Woeseiaceae bacterium]|nr:hypothetical protein [Woeseiaceae bacterium]